MRPRLRLVAALGLLLALGCAAPPAPPRSVTAEEQAALDELLGLMRQRLLLMQEVARWKWNANQQTEDPAREEVFLERMAERGARHDLDVAFTRQFFRAQIDAAKQVQQSYHQRWRQQGQGPFPDVPDLQRSLRPRIDTVSDQLLAALGKIRPLVGEDAFKKKVMERSAAVLTGEGIDRAVRGTAIQPLAEF